MDAVTSTHAQTPMTEPAAEMAASPPGPKQSISKAAIRRLAHDVGARLGRDAHESAVREMESYVERIVRHAMEAMVFSRRKSVSLNHMLFAAGVCGGVPTDLRNIDPAGLKHLNKCNPQAPPGLRKDVLWRAEISEASFAKVAKAAARQCQANLRITSQARRMLQLLAEYHIMRGFDKRGTLSSPEETNPMVSEMMGVFDCDCDVALSLAGVVQEVCARAPELLAMGAVKTIDERLVRTALAPSRPWAQDWTPPADFVEAKTVKMVERILRGRAADKRVTTSACAFLAACFRRVVFESRGLEAPCGAPRPQRKTPSTAEAPSRKRKPPPPPEALDEPKPKAAKKTTSKAPVAPQDVAAAVRPKAKAKSRSVAANDAQSNRPPPAQALTS